jgi:hypothetical protein
MKIQGLIHEVSKMSYFYVVDKKMLIGSKRSGGRFQGELKVQAKATMS